MIKQGSCCCYHCGNLFSASEIAFFDAVTGLTWAEQNGSYRPTSGDPGKTKAKLLKEAGVPDQLDLVSDTGRKSLHTRVCPSCGAQLADDMGHYPTYNILMVGLPSSGKTAFCEYTASQAGRMVLKKLGLTLSSPGKISSVKLEATQVGKTKQYRILVTDGKQNACLVFWDVAGELFTNRRAQDTRVSDSYSHLKRTLSNLGKAVDGCLVLLDERNLPAELMAHGAVSAPADADAETAIDEFIQYLRIHRKGFPILWVYNKSDMLAGALNSHSDVITQQSLLFKDALLSKRAMAAHIALSKRLLNSCYANTAPSDPCFTIQLGQPMDGNLLSFDQAKNASLPLIWLLHHFKLTDKLPD